jgi:RecA-family ATPase
MAFKDCGQSLLGEETSAGVKVSLWLLAYLSCEDSREFVLYRLQAWFVARSLTDSHYRKRNYLTVFKHKKT